MNLKKAGSILCATGVMLSLTVPASAAAVPNSNDLMAKEAIVAPRGVMQTLFNSGQTNIDMRPRVVGSATSADSASQLGVAFEGSSVSGRVQVIAYVNGTKYTQNAYIYTGNHPDNTIAFNSVYIAKGSRVEVTVQALDYSAVGNVNNIRAICF